VTGRLSNFSSSLATGAIEYLGFGSPSGRPRWLIRTTLAPLFRAYSTEGSAATMRALFVMAPSLSGTLKSTRIRTRFPARSRSVMLSLLNDMHERVGRHFEPVKMRFGAGFRREPAP